jgi:hypothetical protein
MLQLRPAEYPDLLMVVQVPVGDGNRKRVASLLENR